MTDLRDPTLGDLVAANPSAALVLDAFGLDYCCHGERTLADACATAGVDASVVVEMLADPDLAVDADATWTSLDAPALAALAALELDTHVHIHKEDYVLFPAALRLTER